MCTDPGGQTVAGLRLIQDEPSVHYHRWAEGSWPLSYEVPHVHRSRWTDGRLPTAHLGRAVSAVHCLAEGDWPLSHMRCSMCTDSSELTDSGGLSDGGLPPTHLWISRLFVTTNGQWVVGH
jgi:hypothetical protein